MNTDIFGKEERKEMLTRIERMELLYNSTTKAIASINETLREINTKLDTKPEVVMEPRSEFGEPVPVQGDRMMGFHDALYCDIPTTEIGDEGSMGVAQACYETMRSTDELKKVAVEQKGVLQEIRSHMAETNSLLESISKELISQMVTMNTLLGDMSRKLDGPQPYFPSPNGTGDFKFTNTIPKGTTGGPPNDVSCDAKPYIPKSTYSHDTYDGSPNPLRDDSMTYVNIDENKEDDSNGN